jgi:3-hydroxyisobutyrate dehydrogenase
VTRLVHHIPDHFLIINKEGAAMAYIGTFHVGVLGLGAMGSRLCESLLKAGHTVTVYNRSAGAAQALSAQGAHVAATPREAAQDADYVLCMVRDDDASRAVWTDPKTGALWGMRADAVAIDSSTLTPHWVDELAALCHDKAIPFLHAPVVGSRPQAQAGQLIFLAGGGADWVARSDLLFKAMGAAVHHAGAAHSAAVLKLFINAMFGIQVSALAELLNLARQVGLDPHKAMEVFGNTGAASPAAKVAGTSMLKEEFAPMFPIELVEKDFSYLQATAEKAGCSTPVSLSALRVFRAARDAGWGEQNITAVMRAY